MTAQLQKKTVTKEQLAFFAVEAVINDRREL